MNTYKHIYTTGSNKNFLSIELDEVGVFTTTTKSTAYGERTYKHKSFASLRRALRNIVGLTGFDNKPSVVKEAREELDYYAGELT